MAAIYQRARPATFAQVVGQEHVKEVLQAALERGRASHAYLFSGPRGVGKTTTARLLAMALNCDTEGERPCGHCSGCRLVREGSHPDVIELDAASNNSVDDVRDLREKTALASMRGGSRVWILDEAHMLSKAAANALLKTLEEPPPGLVFVLATTEPEKLPPTVLSRCQHFRFRRLSESEIVGKLQLLCGEAGVDAQEEALALVARAADGAMRDAESLLERLITPGTTITFEEAEEALGLPPAHRVQRLAQALAEADLGDLLAEAEALYRDGFAPRTLVESLLGALRDVVRARVLGSSSAGREGAEGGGAGGAAAGEGGAGRDGAGREGAGRVGAAGGAADLPLEREQLLRLISTLDDEQERFIRRDDLYSLEVALLKCVHALSARLADRQAAPASSSEVAQSVDTIPSPPARAATGPVTRRASTTAGGAPAAAGGTDRESGDGAREGGGDLAGDLPPFDPTGRGAAPLPPGAARRSRGGTSHDADPAGGATAPSVGQPPSRGDSPRDGGQAEGSSPDGHTVGLADEGVGSDGEGVGESAPATRKLDWHKVRGKASPQLKAFLMPARESVEGSDVYIRFGETHRFHYTQLKGREDELARLVEEVGGPGFRIHVLAPGEETPKKP